MRNKIKEALKTAYKSAGFGEKAFDGVADFLATSVTDEAGIETAVAGVAGLLKAFQSDTDKVRTEKVALEAKLAALEPKPAAEPAKKPDEGGNEPPAWAKALIDSNAALSAKLQAIEGEKTTNSRTQQLKTAMEKAPEKIREQYEKDLSRMNFESDEDFSTWLGESKTRIDAFVQEAASKGAVFNRPMGNGAPPPDKVSPEVEARIKAREAVTEAPAIIGLSK